MFVLGPHLKCWGIASSGLAGLCRVGLNLDQPRNSEYVTHRPYCSGPQQHRDIRGGC